MFNYFRNCSSNSSNAYQAVTSLPHDALQPQKTTRRVCCVIARVDRMRSCGWHGLTNQSSGEGLWNQRSQDGGPIARGNRMHCSCRFSISACGKLAWGGLTNQSSGGTEVKEASESCGLVPTFLTAALAKPSSFGLLSSDVRVTSWCREIAYKSATGWDHRSCARLKKHAPNPFPA